MMRNLAASAIVFCGSVAGAASLPPARFDNLLLLDAAAAGPRIIAVGERGSILVSEDAGASWSRAESPSEATLTAVFFLNEQKGWAVGHDAVILATEDGGATWRKVFEAPREEKPLLSVWFADARKGFAAGAYGSFYETQDGGRSWKPRKVLPDDRHINALAGGPDGALFLAGESGLLVRSLDGGRTWSPLASPYNGSFFGILRTGGRGLVLFGLRGHLYHSADLGRTWSAVEAGTQASLLGGRLLSDGTVVLVGYEGAVLTSRNGGKSFTIRRRPEGKALAAAVGAGAGLVVFGESGAARDPGGAP